MSKKLDDKTLDGLLATYRLTIDSGEAAIDTLARAARIRAVQMKTLSQTHGLFGMVAEVFGWRRASSAAWSALAGMAFAAVIGISLGASDNSPLGQETAFSIDFDSVMGTPTIDNGVQVEQD